MRLDFSFFLRSLAKHWNYLFWVGFEALGGAFLRLVSTAFFGSWMAPLNLFRFAEIEAKESNNLLGWFLTLGWVFLQQWRDSGEQMSKLKSMKTKTANKALWMNFIVLFCWRRNVIEMTLELRHSVISSGKVTVHVLHVSTKVLIQV